MRVMSSSGYNVFKMNLKSKISGIITNIKKKKGFITKEDGVYYYLNGELVKGFTILKKKKYYFHPQTGKMLVGLHTVENGGTYYFLEEGDVYRKGMLTIDDKKYYFSKVTGNMQNGIRTVDDNTRYYFLEEGDIFRGESKRFKDHIPQHNKFEVDAICYFDELGRVKRVEYI